MLITFWKSVPPAGRLFIGLCAFALAGGTLGSLVGHDGVGAMLGVAAYGALMIRYDGIL